MHKVASRQTCTKRFHVSNSWFQFQCLCVGTGMRVCFDLLAAAAAAGDLRWRWRRLHLRPHFALVVRRRQAAPQMLSMGVGCLGVDRLDVGTD